MTTIPDKTGSTSPGLNKQIGPLVLNILLVILSAATLVPPLHCVGGIFLLVGCGVHVALHGRWLKAVILETPKNMTPALRRQRRLFCGKLFSGFLCGLSGLVIGFDTLPLALEPHFFDVALQLRNSASRSERLDLWRLEYLPSGAASSLVWEKNWPPFLQPPGLKPCL